MVDTRTKRLLHLQRLMGRLAVVFLAPLAVLVIRLAGYRVRNLSRVRRGIRRVTTDHRGPWLLCANHLTLIDSVILAYAMAPVHEYMLHYQRLPWNLPEKRNFHKNVLVAAWCYLVKCIPVVRRGDRKHIRATLEKCVYLLEKRERMLVFPEGTRSRSGRVDQADFAYGVGRFLERVQGCRVLCLYLRGDRQTTYTSFPRLGERFTLDIAVLEPSTEHRGLRAQKDYAGQVIQKLGRMEDAYFASRRERPG